MEHPQDIEFHSTLEPHIIIDDDSDEEYEAMQKKYKEKARMDFLRRMGPEVSLIPIKRSSKRPDVYEKDDYKAQTRGHHPIEYVDVGELDKEGASDSYSGSKRKSLPLEKCPICKKFFRRMKTHLLKHAETNTNPSDPLMCQFCSKIFNSGSNLSIHLRTHTGDKPYICQVCQKGFAQSCNLVNHMRIHTGERPFKCPHCDRAFTQSGNLNNHIRLHTDEKPFKCHFCERAFTQSGNLNSHIKNNHREFFQSVDLF